VSDSKLIVATSLSPADPRGVQPAAITSWLAHGCDVVSVNTADEIAALTPAFPGVEFETANRTAERYARRPVPYIYDVLQAARARASQGDAVAIANADIFLRPADGLKDFMHMHAQSGLVLGPRVDVADIDAFESYSAPEDPTYSIGYDYFVMSPAIADDIKDSPFAMGMPFWDYWLPLTCFLAGHTLRTLKSPVALHAHHETRWDDTIYLFFHALIGYALEQSQPEGVTGSVSDRRLAFFLNTIAHHYGQVLEHGTNGRNGEPPSDSDRAALADFYDHFQEAAVHTIKSNAETIRLPAS
jgi:hypothetical protein